MSGRSARALMVMGLITAAFGPSPAIALDPAPMPIPRVGDTWIFTDDEGKHRVGREQTMRAVAVDGETVTLRFKNGCEVTRQINPFYPRGTWKTCDGDSGTQQITREDGALFPLQVGNRQIIEFKGQSSLAPQPWIGRRECVVEGTERLEVKFQEHETFKVVCDEVWFRRTWYYAPAIETSVRFEITNKQAQTTQTLELIEFERGG